MLKRIICRIGGHRRSARNAFFEAGSWHSHCKRCGTKLVRVAPAQWCEQPVTAHPQRTAVAPRC
jgi:hypothetical protein